MDLKSILQRKVAEIKGTSNICMRYMNTNIYYRREKERY